MKLSATAVFMAAILLWATVHFAQGELNYACPDCDDIDPRLQQFCREVVDVGQPCSSYRLVWQRLCRRTCLGVQRMKCQDQYMVCEEDPDCPDLCRRFFGELCPPVEDASNWLHEQVENQVRESLLGGGGGQGTTDMNVFLQTSAQTQNHATTSTLAQLKLDLGIQSVSNAKARHFGRRGRMQSQMQMQATQDWPTEQYTVKKGDWLSKIAPAYDITVEDILQYNPFITNPDLIYPGQVLSIPIKTKTTARKFADPCPGTPLY